MAHEKSPTLDVGCRVVTRLRRDCLDWWGTGVSGMRSSRNPTKSLELRLEHLTV